jgi:hypothetical protein
VKIIDIQSTQEAAALFRRIGVDAYGIGAMAPKACQSEYPAGETAV